MAEQDVFLLGQAGRGGALARGQIMRDLRQEPGAAIGAAADHHAIGAGAAQRLGGLLPRW